MGINGHLVKSTFVSALGGLLFGFDTAVIAGTTHQLTDVYKLTPYLLGITVSSALWGTVVGAITAGHPGERWGRRDSLRIMAVFYFLSALGCALSWNWGSLIAFRIIGGLGIGGSSVLAPMYIAELSPAKWRGTSGWLLPGKYCSRHSARLLIELSDRANESRDDGMALDVGSCCCASSVLSSDVVLHSEEPAVVEPEE